MIRGDQITRAQYTDGPSESGYWTAGINVPTESYGRPSTHYNAIEFHSKDRDIAEERRDFVLRVLQEHGIIR